jgi:hypothetical protein
MSYVSCPKPESRFAAQIGEKAKPAMRDAAAAVRTASRATALAPAGNRSGAPSASAQREIST